MSDTTSTSGYTDYERELLGTYFSVVDGPEHADIYLVHNLPAEVAATLNGVYSRSSKSMRDQFLDRLRQGLESQGKQLEDHVVLERAGETGVRPEGAIGIQTLRGGDNPGEHTVYFIGGGERVELTHRAATRGHFARGAVRAAAWLVGKEPGLYRIEQVLGLD